jgi:anti-anti-sigma regulatory factor
MPSEVRHLIDDGQPFPVVQLIGVLDAGTAPQIRSVLLDGLAQQPEALVVDVFDLSVADPAAVMVLRDVADETVDWPAAHLVLCAPPGNRLWHTTGLPVWSSRSDALTALGGPEPTHQLSLALDPVVGAARRSRELVTEACARWDLADLIGPACIVVTEMVNNVVAHARTAMTVRLALRAGSLTVAVRDHSPGVPRFTGAPATTSYGGRGLLLIDSVARRWGNLLLGDGKVVWAILHRDDESMKAKARTPAGAGDTA